MANPTAAGQVQGRPGHKMSNLLKQTRDYYDISSTQYESSIIEGAETIDMYHNRQYTAAQLKQLEINGQPAETFNIIKMFSNVLIGYLETVVTQTTAEPRYPANAIPSLLVNDVLQYTLDENDFETTQKFVKIDGILTGLMCVYEDVIDTGEKDMFGRTIYSITVDHIPSWQVRIDPHSMKEDYSDARFIHHFKWMSEEAVKAAFPKKNKELVEYFNFLEKDEQAEWDRVYKDHDVGRYRDHDNYLVVKSIVRRKGKIWSLLWHDDILLEKEEITYKKISFPYRVVKMSKSDRAEYYGPFRDITETQKAINQALLQIQLLVNTSKAFVEDGSVEDIEEFRELFGRVNAVIPVLSMQGIKIEDMSRDVMAQYSIIDQALTRVKMVLGINDSFLGQAYASDSGRKVQMQKMSSAAQLTMIVDRVAALLKFVGQDVVGLIQEYYRGNQMMKIADPLNTFHYVEVNKPLMVPTGEFDEMGEMVMQPKLIPDVDPATGEPSKDENDNYIMVPLNDPKTDIEFTDVEVVVNATRADNADEKNQLLFETFTNGPMGQMLMNANPAGAFRTLAMQVSEFGTKHSIEIARTLMETAMQIEQGQVDPRLVMAGTDVAAILGGAMGGSTGNVQNTPQPGSGQQPGNTGGIPQTGNEGGRPPQGGM